MPTERPAPRALGLSTLEIAELAAVVAQVGLERASARAAQRAKAERLLVEAVRALNEGGLSPQEIGLMSGQPPEQIARLLPDVRLEAP